MLYNIRIGFSAFEKNKDDYAAIISNIVPTPIHYQQAQISRLFLFIITGSLA